MRRFALVVGLLALVVATVLPHMTGDAASSFADPKFQQQWEQGEAITPNFWGPLMTAREGQKEPYKEAEGGQRLVQYFDKGRMELTNSTVTNGLLATEMITSATFRVFELYLVVALYYLTLTTLWGIVQQWIERRFGEPTQGKPAGNGLFGGGLQWLRSYGLQRDR